jgi:arylsulfatase A-like enzyme/cytochrome c-type biogenesis protein CcmH/NrfG
MTLPSRLAATLAIASLVACRAATPPTPPTSSAPVVVISIDTLRSDHLGVYGYTAGATPAIDALRRDSVLFTHAYSHVPLTLPAHVSLLSGTLPGEHGVRDNVGYAVAPALAPWLPSLLAGHGYATGGFVSSFVLRHATGVARGFATYDDHFPRAAQATMAGVGRPGQATLDAAKAWLGGQGGKPLFLFFHVYEPHLPYQPPPPFDARFTARPYDGEIAEADRVVGLLLDELKRLGIYDRALVVLLSDHGEGLGDHGEDEHGLLLYRESLQVPLLVKLPGGARAGQTVDQPAQLVDLVPTVIEVLGLEPIAGLAGSSWLSLASPRTLYAETYYPQIHFGWQPLRSVIGEGHHYIESTAPELYDLAADPAESRNRLTDDRRLAGRLRDAARGFARPLAAPAAADQSTRQELAALGYLSGAATSTADPESLPRPQDRIGVLRAIQAALRDARHGDVDAGIAALDAILRENPLILDAWSELGTALDRRARHAEALRAFEKAFELSGRSAPLALPVIDAKLKLGRPAEALALARWARDAGAIDGAQQARFASRLAAAGDPAGARVFLADSTAPEAQAALAESLVAGGRPREGLALAERAAAQTPNAPAVLEQVAYARLALGDWAGAKAAAERAVAADERRANAWNHLGVARYQTGDAAGALAAWERAVALDPDLYDTLFNLGLKAAEQGRRDRAIWALERFLAQAPPARYAGDFARARQVLAAVRRESR